MREIEFKGKRKYKGDWVIGYFVKTNGGHSWLVQMNCFGGLLPKDCFDVVPETVCQYSGHRDKNNEKIYEFDRAIYEMGDEVLTGTIIFDKDYLYWKFVYESTDVNDKVTTKSMDFIETESEEYQVIGNVYDNSSIK